MKTPIDDFVRKYADSPTRRLHMPGHKGRGELERYDITEIAGADSLYEAEGIIAESEANASAHFGAHTLYSAEGSSQCIRAMLYLAAVRAAEQGHRPLILAGRNAHKTFVSGAALLDMPVEWLTPEGADSYLCCPVTAEQLEARLKSGEPPAAVYITSPDYLGNRADVESIACVCRRHNVLLLVDNAHGAYLKFLPEKAHPMDLGADMCCDSAHKTLPALTGGAYLHISRDAPPSLAERARSALSLFGSTSPSYLILASLDRVNSYIAQGYPKRLEALCRRVDRLKAELLARGFELTGDEPLKLTLCPKSYGYTGESLGDELRGRGIEPEFCDPDYTVLMLTPESEGDLDALQSALFDIPRREPVESKPPRLDRLPTAVMTPRAAIIAQSELLPIDNCVGRIAAALTVGCPPAVPIVVSGERVDAEHLPVLRYYGIEKLRVVK